MSSDHDADKRYHKIYIPLSDIYRQGGPITFQELRRKGEGAPNLVIYPSQFNDSIDAPGKTARTPSAGEEDVLQFLKDARNKGQKLSPQELQHHLRGAESLSGMKVTVFRVHDGLHLAYVDHDQLRGESFSMAKLEEIVRNSWQAEEGRRPIILSTNPGYHVKYDNLGLVVEEPSFLVVDADIVNRGTVLGNDDLLEMLTTEKDNRVPLDFAVELLGQELYMNQFIKFVGSRQQFAHVTGDYDFNQRGRVVKIDNPRIELIKADEHGRKIRVGNHIIDSVLGVKPRDLEQFVTLQHGLYSRNVDLLFICGKQGSGKTLLAYAAAVDKVLHYDKETRVQRCMSGGVEKGGYFKQIVLLKPTDVIGGKRRDPGALPGDLLQKLGPHLEPYADAHNTSVLGRFFPFKDMFLHPKYENEFGGPRSKNAIEPVITPGNSGKGYMPPYNEAVQVVHSGFVRGRSFMNTLVIVDEAQNFTPYELKTIIARIGEGSACIVMGDPWQHDNPECTRGMNGLTYNIRNFLPKEYSALIMLSRNYRHKMSEDTDDMHVYSM